MVFLILGTCLHRQISSPSSKFTSWLPLVADVQMYLACLGDLLLKSPNLEEGISSEESALSYRQAVSNVASCRKRQQKLRLLRGIKFVQ